MKLDNAKRPEEMTLPEAKAPGSYLHPNAFHTSTTQQHRVRKALLFPGPVDDTPQKQRARSEKQASPLSNRVLFWRGVKE